MNVKLKEELLVEFGNLCFGDAFYLSCTKQTYIKAQVDCNGDGRYRAVGVCLQSGAVREFSEKATVRPLNLECVEVV